MPDLLPIAIFFLKLLPVAVIVLLVWAVYACAEYLKQEWVE